MSPGGLPLDYRTHVRYNAGMLQRPEFGDLRQQIAAERNEIHAGLQQVMAAAGAVDRERLRWILAADRSELWRTEGCRNMAQLLSALFQVSNWKARRWIAAAYALEHLPAISTALEAGALSLDKTVELTRFATRADEADLVGWARRVGVARVRQRADEETRRSLDQVKEEHSSRRLQWEWWEGMLEFEGALPPDQGMAFVAAIDGLAADLAPDPSQTDYGSASIEPAAPQRRADALMRLVAGARHPSQAGPDETVVLHAPLAALRGDSTNCTLEGGPVLHPETARRLACDARLQVVLHGDDGNALGIGKRSQIAPRWLRRQVLYRDGDRCTFPGCEESRYVNLHHIVHWSRGGPTDLTNLVTVCSFHHTMLHELGWSVRLDGRASPVWFRPNGQRLDPGPAPPDTPRERVTKRHRFAEAVAYSRLFDAVLWWGARPKVPATP